MSIEIRIPRRSLIFFLFNGAFVELFFFVVAVAIAFEDEDRHADGSSRRVMSWPKSVFCCLFFVIDTESMASSSPSHRSIRKSIRWLATVRGLMRGNIRPLATSIPFLLLLLLWMFFFLVSLPKWFRLHHPMGSVEANIPLAHPFIDCNRTIIYSILDEGNQQTVRRTHRAGTGIQLEDKFRVIIVSSTLTYLSIDKWRNRVFPSVGGM